MITRVTGVSNAVHVSIGSDPRSQGARRSVRRRLRSRLDADLSSAASSGGSSSVGMTRHVTPRSPRRRKLGIHWTKVHDIVKTSESGRRRLLWRAAAPTRCLPPGAGPNALLATCRRAYALLAMGPRVHVGLLFTVFTMADEFVDVSDPVHGFMFMIFERLQELESTESGLLFFVDVVPDHCPPHERRQFVDQVFVGSGKRAHA